MSGLCQMCLDGPACPPCPPGVTTAQTSSSAAFRFFVSDFASWHTRCEQIQQRIMPAPLFAFLFPTLHPGIQDDEHFGSFFEDAFLVELSFPSARGADGSFLTESS